MDVLITCGATRNPIDAMRVLTARSSGTTGVAIARALAEIARVHVLGNPEAVLRAPDLHVEEYGSTRDLMARMEAWIRAHPSAAVIHAAAVGDYERKDAQASKIPSGAPEITLTLTPTPKIADHVRGWGLTGPFVTFKAASPETTNEQLVAIADRQRIRTGSDLVFANVLGRITSDVALVGPDGPTWFTRRDDALAALIRAIRARGVE